MKIDYFFILFFNLINYGKEDDILTLDFYKNNEEIHFLLKFNNIYYNAIIWQRSSDIISSKSTINIIKANASCNYEENVKSYIENLYQGYLLEIPNNSSLSGYIRNGQCFIGHLIINNTLYYIEPNNNDLLMLNNMMEHYGSVNDTIEININNNFQYKTKDQMKLVEMSENQFLQAFKIWKKNGRLCPLVIVVDYSFFTEIHKSNTQSTIYQILLSLEEVNAIFRSTDFDLDGLPDNIGITVNKIFIINDPGRKYYIFNYSKHHYAQVVDFLFKFKTFTELSNHCLGLLFTAQIFSNNVIGASFVPDTRRFNIRGGICEVIDNTINLNALVISGRTDQGNIPQIVFETTIAHELGHSFGSLHDEFISNCYGHLMSSQTFNDYKTRKHLIFSKCSKQQIIRALVAKSKLKCFNNVTESFCGNGIIENNEDCDCGLIGDCLLNDPCCIPRRTQQLPCKVNRKLGYDCHPSEGKCCTKQCQYAINCNGFNNKCPCKNRTFSCKCGINGECINDTCHSIECTRLNLTECKCNINNTCQICCQINSKCLPSIQATKEILSNRNFTIKKIKKESIGINSAHWQHRIETFCQDNDCVRLDFFHSTVIGSDCLINGKLGKCNGNYQCVVIERKQIFPLINCSFLIKFSVKIIIFFILCLIKL